MGWKAGCGLLSVGETGKYKDATEIKLEKDNHSQLILSVHKETLGEAGAPPE